MSDSKDHPLNDEAPDVEVQSPAEADEKTVFDTEMLARLDALGDDEDDELADDEPSPGASTSSQDDLLPSQISSLKDIGDHVEPLTADIPMLETNPSSSLERLITDEIGEETKEAPEELEFDEVSQPSRSRVTRPGFQSGPRAVIDMEATPAEGAQSTGTAEQIESPNDNQPSAPTGADLWDEARVFIGNQYLKNGVHAPKIKEKHISEEMVSLDLLRRYRR